MNDASTGSARGGKKRDMLTPQDWINAAREILVHEGAERVRIEPLAEKLGVSRGSFYWHFEDRAALLEALLDLWRETAHEPMRAVAADRSLDPVARYEKFMRVWVQGEPYCPVLDLAIRRWALVDPEVAREVNKMDKMRIKLLTDIFHDMGYDADEALVRARITYFHQIGYYATDVRDTPQRRSRLWPIYVKVMAGAAAPPDGPTKKR
jgi:AcrR family transcriptional regulator